MIDQEQNTWKDDAGILLPTVHGQLHRLTSKDGSQQTTGGAEGEMRASSLIRRPDPGPTVHGQLHRLTSKDGSQQTTAGAEGEMRAQLSHLED